MKGPRIKSLRRTFWKASTWATKHLTSFHEVVFELSKLKTSVLTVVSEYFVKNEISKNFSWIFVFISHLSTKFFFKASELVLKCKKLKMKQRVLCRLNDGGKNGPTTGTVERNKEMQDVKRE